MELYVISYLEVASGKLIDIDCLPQEEAYNKYDSLKKDKTKQYHINCYEIKDNVLLFHVAKNLFKSSGLLFRRQHANRPEKSTLLVR